MEKIIDLLFEQYTKNLDTSKCRVVMRENQAIYQQFIELVGMDMAIEVWDAAEREGAAMNEECFHSGVQVGIALILELLSL